MITTVPENVLFDPIVVLELFTLVCTFYYIAKTVMSDEDKLKPSTFRVQNMRLAGTGRLEQQLLSFFGVGALISQPKTHSKSNELFVESTATAASSKLESTATAASSRLESAATAATNLFVF